MKQETEAIYAIAYRNTEIDIDERLVYHLAGQAAAIYLGNKHKQLPAVHFNIRFDRTEKYDPQTGRITRTYDRNSAELSGGQLIHHLPVSFVSATHFLSWFQQAEYRCAFEADVSNLLAGPLAEAKYVALRDGETFNANLVNLKALHNYGGGQNIELVNEYMECLIPNKTERKQKLAELFSAACNFVNNQANWNKISALAEFIQNQPSGIIHCEEVICVFDKVSEVTTCQ